MNSLLCSHNYYNQSQPRLQKKTTKSVLKKVKIYIGPLHTHAAMCVKVKVIVLKWVMWGFGKYTHPLVKRC